MSTDHQKYSTQNQSIAIAEYAAARGFDIVRSYADEGRSGLKLAGRNALQALIDDVSSGAADFDHVLVYDVSRWGRFQDADESAYYEFICRKAGISVHYCAEQFENDGSLSATIIKGMKRVMAGEYSRELSAKVFAGQCRLIELGYRQGGPAGYGLRRQLIGEHNELKSLLRRGEHKSLQTDRVVLVPGPPDEVAVVQRVYSLFVDERRSEREIAEILNSHGIPADYDRPWSRLLVRQILSNEKYIGNNVYNRVSFKLRQKRVSNTPDMWIRKVGAFEPVVEPGVFLAAQEIFAERAYRFSNDELLRMLAELLSSRGALSGLIIDEIDEMPSSAVYRHRFGSLVRAYHLIGYAPERDYRYLETNRLLRLMHPEIVTDTHAEIERLGGSVLRDPKSDLLIVNKEISISIVLARCQMTGTGALRWKIRLDTKLRPDITVVVRLDEENRKPHDYYLLPWIDVGSSMRIRMAEDNGLYLDAYRTDDLASLYHLTRRHYLGKAA